MKQVSREEFYKRIGEENVTVTPTGEFPYKTNFALKNGRIIGFIQDTEALDVSEYYISERLITKEGEESEDKVHA